MCAVDGLDVVLLYGVERDSRIGLEISFMRFIGDSSLCRPDEHVEFEVVWFV